MGWEKCKAITITLKGEPKAVLDLVKKEAAKNDVIITGDEKKGEMKHKSKDVKGTYSVAGKKLTIKMEEGIWYASCDQVNAEVQKWFKGK